MNIFIFKDGKQQGPYTVGEARRRCIEGKLAETDPAWHEGLGDWIPLNQVEGFSYLTPSAAVPVAPPSSLPRPPVSRTKDKSRAAGSGEVKKILGALALFAAWAVVLFFLIEGSTLVIGGGIAATGKAWAASGPTSVDSFQSTESDFLKYNAENNQVIQTRSAMAAILVAGLIAAWAFSWGSVADGFRLFRRFGAVGASIVPTFLAFGLLVYTTGMFALGGAYGANHPFKAYGTAAAKAWLEDEKDFLGQYRFTVLLGSIVAAFILAEIFAFVTFLRGSESDTSVFFKRLATSYLLFCVFFVLSIVLVYYGVLAAGIHVTADELLSLNQQSTGDEAIKFKAKLMNVLCGYVIALMVTLIGSLYFAFQLAFSDFFPWCRTSSDSSRGGHRFRRAL